MQACSASMSSAAVFASAKAPRSARRAASSAAPAPMRSLGAAKALSSSSARASRGACVRMASPAAAPQRRSVALQAVASSPKSAEAAMGTTYSNWLLMLEREGVLDSELTIVLNSINTACKRISSLVARAGLSGMTGLAGGAVNIQGEDQKKLDVISNDVFCDALRVSGRTGVIASEEEDVPVAVEESYGGNYICVFDPLDGSSNIDAAVSTGSIFGVYAEDESCKIDFGSELTTIQEQCVTATCQPGSNLLAAGYCMYSSSCILVVSVGTGCYGFTLDTNVGEFLLTHPNMRIPESGKIYSFNEGNYANWSPELQKYMDSLKTGGAANDGKPYSARYIGSLVGDFHRTMLYGGIYGYPGDKKNVNGKLRLLYECAPMSFLMEQAGGMGSTGTERVLDIDPDAVHQRVPFFTGSPKEVQYLESFLK